MAPLHQDAPLQPLGQEPGAARQTPVCAGEMVFPWMFEDLAGLRPLKSVADLLAADAGWPQLYSLQQLGKNPIHVASATYFEDMCAQALAFALQGSGLRSPASRTCAPQAPLLRHGCGCS